MASEPKLSIHQITLLYIVFSIAHWMKPKPLHSNPHIFRTTISKFNYTAVQDLQFEKECLDFDPFGAEFFFCFFKPTKNFLT